MDLPQGNNLGKFGFHPASFTLHKVYLALINFQNASKYSNIPDILKSIMECNVGLIEQKVRILAGLTLIGVGAYYNAKPLAALGIIPILTGITRYCPINAAIGYNGCTDIAKESQAVEEMT